MTMRGIDHDHIDTGVTQRGHALERVGAGADRRADAQAPGAVLAGAGEFRGLLEILHRDHAAQLVVDPDHQHFLDAVLVQQALHLVLGCALAHRHQPLLGRHDGGDRRIELELETQVAVGNDADHLGAAHDRHAGDAAGARELYDLADRGIR